MYKLHLSFVTCTVQRLDVLITPWRDHHQRTTRPISLNGIDVIDSAQIRLTSPEATDEV